MIDVSVVHHQLDISNIAQLVLKQDITVSGFKGDGD